MANPTRNHHHLLLMFLSTVSLWSYTTSSVRSLHLIAPTSSSLRQGLGAPKAIHSISSNPRKLQNDPTSRPSSSSPPPCPSSSSGTTTIQWLIAIVLAVIGIMLGIALGFVTAKLFSAALRFTRNALSPAKPVQDLIVYHPSINSKSIAFLRDLDNALDGLEVLGRGGSGEVYKASLTIFTKDGLASSKIVAIKKVNAMGNTMKKKKKKKRRANMMLNDEENDENGLNGPGADVDALTRNSAQIRAEMDTLGKVRHRNLVTLLAYVPRSPNAHLLIYDFMVNGSLNDALAKVRRGTLVLDWPMRYRIALGVAKALKYLHNDARPKIIHRDLKPGNILLDEAMEARLGDFGLAKLLADDTTHVTGSNWVGTHGYVGPEYANTLQFTDKGDVYAFGVVLVVLLTNRQPNNKMFEHRNNYLGGWVADMLVAGPEQILDKCDKRLLGHGFEEQVLLTFRIASYCLAMSPTSRPSSLDVLEMLDQVGITPMNGEFL